MTFKDFIFMVITTNVSLFLALIVGFAVGGAKFEALEAFTQWSWNFMLADSIVVGVVIGLMVLVKTYKFGKKILGFKCAN
jgi:hypothetical protein